MSGRLCPRDMSGRFRNPIVIPAIAWLVAICLAVAMEAHRIKVRLIGMATTGGWSGTPDPDATFILPILLLAPLCWLFPTRLREGDESTDCRTSWLCRLLCGPATSAFLKVAGFLGVAFLSLAVSVSAARQAPFASDPTPFGESVPAMHDELSYLLQARSFLEGRWWWPGPAITPELFQQVHVLNDGRFASRYFPGTGAWIAPFLAINRPIWGHWLAGMLIAGLVFAIGCQIGNIAVGTIAGALTALSPGIAIFSNLLLAHHPTLVGLMIFLWAFVHLMRGPRIGWAAIAGTGLAFAMLCRPMTAAAVGLPFGVWYLTRLVAELRHGGNQKSRRTWQLAALGLAAPLIAGFCVLGIQNRAITGSVATTPYGLYTKLYTPRHVYGFNNGIRGNLSRSSMVDRNYDDWALNLTVELAADNFERRVRSSFEWTLGIVPLTMTAVLFLAGWPKASMPLRLIFAAIVSLHVLHLPYWLDGILHYHYVFESGPLWLLLFSSVSVDLIESAAERGRGLFFPWWLSMVAACVAVNLFPVASGDSVPRMRAGLAHVIPDPHRYRKFERAIADPAIRRPALVLVRTTPADLHVEYVRNLPPFDKEILVGRYRPELYDLATVAMEHAGRTIYLYDTRTGELRLAAEGD